MIGAEGVDAWVEAAAGAAAAVVAGSGTTVLVTTGDGAACTGVSGVPASPLLA